MKPPALPPNLTRVGWGTFETSFLLGVSLELNSSGIQWYQSTTLGKSGLVRVPGLVLNASLVFALAPWPWKGALLPVDFLNC